MAINFNTTYSEDKQKKDFTKKFDDFFAKLFPVPLKEKLFFLQHLSVMVRSGISLSVALKTLTKQTENKNFSNIISDIGEKVERGVSFTESLRYHEKDFGELFVNMVEAGEMSGKLESVLNQLYIQTKKQYELKSKIKSALTYPVVIVCAMFGIGIFMMVVVIPQMTSTFKEMNVELPLATKVLIGISDVLSQNGPLSLLLFVIFIIIFIKIIKTKKGKFYFQAALLKMPIIGPIVKKINLAHFSRTISSLLKTDIMIIKTFQITANTLGNVHYRDALLKMSDKIKEGGSIASVINDYPVMFPPIVSQMVSVGEDTGELDSILSEMAEFFEGEVNETMTNLPAIIEPLLIVVLGCGVGAMAIAIIMPMYNLSSSI